MPLSGTVKQVMDTNIPLVEAGSKVSEALKTMLAREVWSIVVTKKGLPLGVVTDHDILVKCVDKGFDPHRMAVEEIMSAPLILIDADATVGEAMAKMVQSDVRRLYIVERGKIVGRVTEKSVLKHTLGVMLSLSAGAL
jgi:predicted transcriptional regulator